MPELHCTHNTPPNLRNAVLIRNAVQSPVRGAGVYARHMTDSANLERICYDCDKSVLIEGDRRLIWPKVFAKIKGMPVQSVYNRIARKKLEVEVRHNRIYVVCE